MQKWEYLFVIMDYSREKPQGWRPHYINGNEQKDWGKGLSYIDFSNQMGNEGWELVSSETITNSTPLTQNVDINHIRLVFKRLK